MPMLEHGWELNEDETAWVYTKEEESEPEPEPEDGDKEKDKDKDDDEEEQEPDPNRCRNTDAGRRNQNDQSAEQVVRCAGQKLATRLS